MLFLVGEVPAVQNGPNGKKRKADVIGNAILVMKIAMGEARVSACRPQ